MAIRFIILGVLSVLAFVWILDIYYPIDVTSLNNLSRVVTAKDGRWLYTQTNTEDKWRFEVDISQIDPLYIKTLLSFEDKRFWSHIGMDPLAMARAIAQFVRYRRITSGGSTITMQLARLLEPKPRTVSSKILEIIRAFQLEYHYSKKQILEAYLTLAPYGGNIEGIVAASLRYFDKQPFALSPSEVALLVALPKSPESNRPDRHPKRSKKARDRVLAIERKEHIINQKQYKNSIDMPLPTKLKHLPRYAPHLSQKLLRDKQIKTNKIKTTLDADIQIQLEKRVRDEGHRLSTNNRLTKGSTIALLIADNDSGEIMTYIGSHDMFDPKLAGFVDMINIPRSPGSTLKPFIYAMGFEKHTIHPYTIIDDKQTIFGDYKPHNYSREFNGEVTIEYALQHSLNIPAVKVLQSVGADDFVERIKPIIGSVKIPKNRATLPIALGGLGISIYQLTQLYTALANDGIAHELHYLADGKKNLFTKNFLSTRASRMTTAILRKVTPPKGFTNTNRQIAYKTGTSYGYRDFWTVAYSHDTTVAIWIGRPDNSPQLRHSGVEIAAPLAFEVFSVLQMFKPNRLWSWQPSDVLNSTPRGLKYYEKEKRVAKSKLNILYPKDGSRYQSIGCRDVIAKVHIEHGKAPYYWYIDGKLMQTRKTTNKLNFSKGAHEITIVDSDGESTSSSIWVDTPDCETK